MMDRAEAVREELRELIRQRANPEPERPLPADKFCIDEWEKVR